MTSRLVMKFGGTSVADLERIRRVGRLVAAEVANGHTVAVVVSAMSGKTNELVAWTDAAGPAAPGLAASDDEYDVVVASGEQVTAGLLAMVLRNMGLNARSWLGWQIPIISDEAHGRARIEDIPGEQLGSRIDTGEIAVIAGFQGVTPSGRITTLGRGGSDTSAVAVAAAIKAVRCDIYTDVDGVYTTDPRIEEKAKRLARVSYEEMLEMASLGAKVLQTRSVELAMAQRVPVRVLSSFVEPGEASPDTGTIVCDEEEIMEKRIVSGVAYSRDEAKITLLGLPDHPGVSSTIFSLLADANVNVDMIVQSRSRDAKIANMDFTVGKRDAVRALEIVNAAKAEIGFEDAKVDDNVSKVSVIGVGMRSHVGVAKTMFGALAEKGVNIQAISTSEIKISVLIDAAYTELAVRALHAAYGWTSSEPTAGMAMPDPGLVKRLAPLAALVFFANMAIGLPLPALPQHVHDGLGFGATIVGWAVGMQALVTILTRAPCGRQTDVRGPKWAVLVGLPGAAVAGGAYILSAQLSSQPNLSLAVLLLARAVLGVSESFFLVGAMTWGIARVGPQNTGMVMAWQGIALQASIGVGAPIGLYLQNRFGFAAVGMAAVVSPLLALLIGLAIPATPPVGHRNQGGFLQVMRQVWPQGVALALGMTPFAVLSAFVALHFAARNWGGAGFAIAAFAAGYIAVRLFFAHLPDRMGGSRVAIISLAIEAAGQLILWSATSQAVAIAGAVVSGVGFSLVFPSFGVQAMRKVPPQMRGLAVGAFLAFLDVALGLSAPLAGAVAERHGFASVFLMGALAAIAAIVVAAASRPREKAEPAGA